MISKLEGCWRVGRVSHVGDFPVHLGELHASSQSAAEPTAVFSICRSERTAEASSSSRQSSLFCQRATAIQVKPLSAAVFSASSSIHRRSFSPSCSCLVRLCKSKHPAAMSPSPPLAIGHPSFYLTEPELSLPTVPSQDGAAAETSEVAPESEAPLAGPSLTEDTTTEPALLDEHHPLTAKPEKKRRRPALSCEQCRRRKIRCDRGLPCVNCIKSKISPCTYAPTHIPASRTRKTLNHGQDFDAVSASSHVPARSAPVLGIQKPLPVHNPGPKALSSSVPSSTMGSSSDTSTVDALAARVRELEQKLADSFFISRKTEDKLEHNEEQEEAHAPMKGTISKTRFFGQSHWMNGVDMVSFRYSLTLILIQVLTLSSSHPSSAP